MTHTGSCLCGDVTYAVDGPLADVVNCHCVRCRRHTGHFMAATEAAPGDVTISGDALRWYHVDPDDVEYGFCGTCGSTLFWRAAVRPNIIDIAAGTLDPPTGLATKQAIFVADASDYHRLDPDLPQVPHDR